MIPLQDPHLFRTHAYVNGAWISAESGAKFSVINPASGETLAEVADLGQAETEAAIEAAAAAWPHWRAMTAAERGRILRTWFNLMMDHLEDLAELLTLEQGKPLIESRGEIRYGASFVEWFSEEGKRSYGEVIPAHGRDLRIITLKQPVGVVAAITPWNFPNAMITRKVAPALAAGCPVIIKPAEDTPLSALALAELAERAGIPPGIFNVIPSSRPKEVGAVLTAHSLVRKFSFTGSTAVGKVLMAQCASTVKKVSLELGGNAPFIVFDDADLDAAVRGAIASKYRNAGQTCICTNRLLVQEGVYDKFVEKYVEAVSNLKVGSGMSAGTEVGPLINAAALKKVQGLLSDALEKGADLNLGGKPHKLGGNYFEPTVISGIQSEMNIFHEEIFGPITSLFKFRTEAEAIALANGTPYGLAAYFYARDMGRVWRVSEALEYGMVGINTGLISTASAPFGGIKESGLGREGSRYGLEEFMEVKYLCMGGIGI